MQKGSLIYFCATALCQLSCLFVAAAVEGLCFQPFSRFWDCENNERKAVLHCI